MTKRIDTSKILLVTGILVVVLSLLACAQKTRDQQSTKSRKIGLVYLLKHPAIDQGVEGFREEITRIEKEQGVDFDVTYSNAFGEVKNINTIVRSFVDSNKEVVLALTTPCAQTAKSIVKDRPLIFVGVTDPVGAGLVSSLGKGQGNIVGTTSQAPNFEILQLASKIYPDMRRVGILYSSSEANSISIINSLEAAVSRQAMPIKLIKRSVISTTDILPAAQALASESDALFLINDNMVISSVELLIRTANDNNIPVFSSDTDSVAKGAFFTMGLDYKKEGIAAARMVEALLLENKNPSDIPIYVNTSSHLYINKKFLDRHPLPKDILAGAKIVG